MSPDDRAKETLAAVHAEVRRDLETLARIVSQTQALEITSHEPSAPELAFFALCIDRAYSACEAALLRIARQFDGIVPNGEAWHTSVLHQMTLPIQAVRPALLRPAAATKLEQLLHFRHFLRHAYHVELDWRRLAPLVALLPETAALFHEDLSQAIPLLFV